MCINQFRHEALILLIHLFEFQTPCLPAGCLLDHKSSPKLIMTLRLLHQMDFTGIRNVYVA